MSMMQYFDGATPSTLLQFLDKSKSISSPKVLELGTKRSLESRSTMHKEWFPHAASHQGTDIEAGEDVDFVADVHKLSKSFAPESYDIIVSCSTFEHFKYPHLAAHEILKVLKLGGLLFVQTHFTFPLHAYPYDYFRFTTEALSGCFEGQGVEVIAADYEYPCEISSPADGRHPSYLNTNVFVRKISKTEDNYKYILDTNL
jgi:SAM-dependent methyltransferase